MEGGKTANYWPGFVDALTNVVIAMVFVIVVLAIALSFAAQMMGKKMADELAKAKATVAALSASAAKQQAADAQTPPTTLAASTTIDVKGPSAAAAASSSLRASERSLRLVFADTALSLDEAAAAGLRAALAPRKADAANARVQIVATGPSMALSDNQRSAYIRVLAVRNALIDEGFTVERIAVRIDTTNASPRPAVTVSFPPSSSPSSP